MRRRGPVDTCSPASFIRFMAAKSYAEMTLEEVFELEGRYTATIGHSGVTERGMKRNLARLKKKTQPTRLGQRKPSRTARRAAA